MALLAMAFGMGSCSEDWTPKTEKTGQVMLKDHLGVTVSDIQDEVSRAEHDISSYLVKIYNDQNALVEQWAYSELPEIFSLPVGSYRVDVCSHEVQKAEWDKPYYFGSKEFKIENSKITEIGSVTCSFASIRVTVKFTDELRNAMGDDVKVRVVVGDLGELTYTPDETRSGYYEAVEGSSTMAAFFTGTVKGYNENIHKVYDDVAAGQHRIITFSLKENQAEPDPETGQIDPADGINVDVAVTTEENNGAVIPNEDTENPDDRPGQEVFVDDVELKYDATTATLSAAAPAGLKSLSLTIASDNADATAAFAAINGADLANPGAAASALDSYGIANGQAVAGQTKVDVNLANLIAALKEHDGNHTLTFAATDVKDNSASQDISFKGGVEPITFESKLKCDGTPMNPSNESDGLVTIKAPAGIAHLIVDINSTNDDFASVTAAISGADFAYPGSLAGTLTGFGLANGDAVLNQTTVDFDITTFLAPAFLPSFPGQHDFVLKVEDNDGNTSSITLTFVAE